MGVGKWISGFLGWMMFGPIGGLVGFFLGSLVEKGSFIQIEQGNSPYGTGTGGGYSREQQRTGQRNSFLMSLLVLSTAVIKADGHFVKSELEYVKNFLRQNFGEEAAEQAKDIIKGLMEKDINIYEVGSQIRMYMNYSQRLQLFHYLVALAQSDHRVTQEEIDVLGTIASTIGLSTADTESIMSMFKNDLESAYRVLEITSSATDDEVRKAYKRMALKYHPDKVSTLGEDVQKAAEEKFKNVQEAYEKIKKARGMS
ncbi:MAG: TerB family tellurite resistance protein [Bacteroidales bacterium]|nr:TerB family tellurite resistance protein [Bacteroidales bacterium]MBO7487399.1 TerB family tellurite resistance protein [Bacteroidales bacterium]